MLRFAATEEDYILHPEYLVQTISMAEAPWQRRLKSMREDQTLDERRLLLEQPAARLLHRAREIRCADKRGTRSRGDGRERSRRPRRKHTARQLPRSLQADRGHGSRKRRRLHAQDDRAKADNQRYQKQAGFEIGSLFNFSEPPFFNRKQYVCWHRNFPPFQDMKPPARVLRPSLAIRCARYCMRAGPNAVTAV
jgi:hypothetical protein